MTITAEMLRFYGSEENARYQIASANLRLARAGIKGDADACRATFQAACKAYRKYLVSTGNDAARLASSKKRAGRWLANICHIKNKEDTNMTDQELRNLLEGIAQTHLGVDTLATQNSDSLDFHEVSVWGLRAALEAAYRMGAANGPVKGGERA